MKNNSIYKIVRKVCKPAKLLYYKANNPASRKVQDTIVMIISFAVAGFMIVRSYPFKGFWDFILVAIGAFLLVMLCAFVATLIYPYVVKILTIILLPFSILYDLCDDKINNVTRKRTSHKANTTTKMKKGPRAEVGIKYFIAREKRIQINHAKIFDD